MASSEDPKVKQSPTADQGHRGLRGYACEPCVRRKVRCDRQQPCSACRRRPNDKCVYSAADPRLNKEHHRPTQRRRAASLSRPLETKGRLIVEKDQGKSRYLDEPIWNSLNAIVQNDGELLNPSDDEDDDAAHGNSPSASNFPSPGIFGLLTGSLVSSRISLSSYHPSSARVIQLWQIWRHNVHPIVMLFACWQKEEDIMRAVQDLSNVRSRMEVFLFAVYASSINTLSEEEVQQLMGESKRSCLDRYQAGCEAALGNCRILKTSDLLVLQSFVIYLLFMRQRTDAATLHSMAGLLMRICERIGLHRDGSNLDLSAWETEHRRRLWWQIQKFDQLSSQLAGCQPSSMMASWDVKMPSNIADDDLKPDMGWADAKSSGYGEMMHALVRYEFLWHFRSLKRSDGSKYGADWFRTNEISLAEKDKVVNDFEQLLQTKYMQHYEPTNAIHLMAAFTIRSAICSMRILVHHQHLRQGHTSPPPDVERENLFQWSIKAVEYGILCTTTAVLKHFVWHLEMYFQWMSFAIILSHLCDFSEGPSVDKAWETVDTVYKIRPTFISDMRQFLLSALGELTLRAWSKREKYLAGKGEVRTPFYIIELRQVKANAAIAAARKQNSHAPQPNGNVGGIMRNDKVSPSYSDSNQYGFVPLPTEIPLSVNGEAPQLPVTDVTGDIDWSQWDNWMWSNELQSSGVYNSNFFSGV